MFLVAMTCLLGAALEESASAVTRLDLRIDPLATYFHLVRYAASTKDGVELPAAFEPAVAAAKPLQEKLGGTLAWGPLDRQLVNATTPAELRERFDEIRKIRLFGGQAVDVHADATELGRAVEATFDAYLKDLWPGHEAHLRRVAAEIERDFTPKEAECFAFMLKSLGMTDPRRPIPTYLVMRAQWPGAFTIRHPAGGGLCFMAVERHEGTVLYETMLHEATHALDVSTEEGKSALEILRERLVEGGMSPRDGLLRDVPHTIMFIQAGETIRRIVDPEHQHYGDVEGYYPKVQRVVDIERPIWTEYLDGRIDQAEAIDRIAVAVLEYVKRRTEDG